MAWSIATAPRGSRPDFTLRREPPNRYTTRAQQWFLEQLLALEPGGEDVDGGGYAHKPGYHDTVAHNDARSGVGQDYSARDPEDRRGPRDRTRARDWTFRDAQAGNFRDFAKYGDRLLAAYRRGDPRLAGWREYLGRVSQPISVAGVSTRRIGIDFRHRRLRIPDSSHDWHGHFSEDTERVDSFANKWAMLTVLAGWTLAEWQQSVAEGVSKTDVIDALDDTVPFVSEGVRSAAVAQGWTSGRSTRALLEDLWARIILDQPAESALAGTGERSVASAVLSRLEPEQLADVVVAALPADRARRTAELISARLVATGQPEPGRSPGVQQALRDN